MRGSWLAERACELPVLPPQAPFTQLHIIVAALRSHNVAPALAWVGQHRQELARAAASGADSTLEWQLHRLHFLTLLKQVCAAS
jgi:hypothetical protein